MFTEAGVGGSQRFPHSTWNTLKLLISFAVIEVTWPHSPLICLFLQQKTLLTSCYLNLCFNCPPRAFVWAVHGSWKLHLLQRAIHLSLLPLPSHIRLPPSFLSFLKQQIHHGSKKKKKINCSRGELCYSSRIKKSNRRDVLFTKQHSSFLLHVAMCMWPRPLSYFLLWTFCMALSTCMTRLLSALALPSSLLLGTPYHQTLLQLKLSKNHILG